MSLINPAVSTLPLDNCLISLTVAFAVIIVLSLETGTVTVTSVSPGITGSYPGFFLANDS